MKCWKCGGHMTKSMGTATCDYCGRSVQYGQGKAKRGTSWGELLEVALQLAAVSQMQKKQGNSSKTENEDKVKRRKIVNWTKVVLGAIELICIIAIAILYFSMVKGIQALEILGAIVLLLVFLYVIIANLD